MCRLQSLNSAIERQQIWKRPPLWRKGISRRRKNATCELRRHQSSLSNYVFANNAVACIKTLDSRSKPAVFCASVHKAPVFRLGLHDAGPEVIRENDFTICLDEPH